MAEITLSGGCGLTTLVDDTDLGRCLDRNWFALKRKLTTYVFCNLPRNGQPRRTMLLHRFIITAPAGRWAFMEKFVIPSFDDDSIYLTRWRIVQTPWAALYLHRLTAPDSRPTLHDHPWKFLAIVLRGGYIERRLDPTTMQVNQDHRVRWFNHMRTHDAHAILTLTRNPTWTLLFVGKHERTWGYWEPDLLPDNTEWTWTPFDTHRHAVEFDAAIARRNAAA